MPNFKPLAPLVWEENEVTDGRKDGHVLIPRSVMKFLTPSLLLRFGAINPSFL